MTPIQLQTLAATAHAVAGLFNVPVHTIVAGGAVNHALGGRRSPDVDVFVRPAPLGVDVHPTHDWHAVLTALAAHGWQPTPARNGQNDYTGLSPHTHPQYPGLQVIVAEYEDVPAFLDAFDLPRHRAAVDAHGVVTDARSDAWMTDTSAYITWPWRIDKAVAYGYALNGPLAAAALYVAATPDATFVRYGVYGADRDHTVRGGSVEVQYRTTGGGTASCRISADGTVATSGADPGPGLPLDPADPSGSVMPF